MFRSALVATLFAAVAGENVYYEWRYNPNMGSTSTHIQEAFRAKVTAAMADGSLQGTHNILDGYDGYDTRDDYDYEGPKVIKMNVETDDKAALDAMLGVDAGEIVLNTQRGEQVICPIDLADAENGYFICVSGDQCAQILDLCDFTGGGGFCADGSDLTVNAGCKLTTTTLTTVTATTVTPTTSSTSTTITTITTTTKFPWPAHVRCSFLCFWSVRRRAADQQCVIYTVL
jgi:hypothetical protein